MPLLTVRDAELYHEVRGEGPPLLLIMGATGDGAHFDAVGELLADEFTVVAYDPPRERAQPASAWLGVDFSRGAGG